MRHILLVALLVVGWSRPSLATFEDGKQAYDRGDYTAAYHLWKVSAEDGDARAQTNLGVLYALGRGVKVDPRTAVAWYRRAAKQGFAKGQYNLGLAYRAGKGTPKDETKAAALFGQAAEQGLASAQYMLGFSLLYGRGVERDPAQALQWYRRSALSGYRKAQYSLGRLHAKGIAVTKNPAKAVPWYRRASEKGYGPAQVRLGLAYLRGEGVEVDPVQAFVWLSRGVKRVRGKLAETAKQRLAELETRLSGKQLAQARSLFEPETDAGGKGVGAAATGSDLAHRAGCLKCHGSEGLDHPFIPVIAGQKRRYLRNQLRRLRLPPEESDPEIASALRHDHVMGPIARKLSHRDIDALAVFFSKKPCRGGSRRAGVKAPPEVKQCAECHGGADVSKNAAVPNLVGQREQYLVRQLKLYRDIRSEVPLPEVGSSRHHAKMSQRPSRLSADQIRALARYFAGLPCR